MISLILIRHGESEANVDPSLYFSKPDYTMTLTSKGEQQVSETAKKLDCDPRKTKLVTSTWVRTRQTADIIKKTLKLSDENCFTDALIHEISLSHSIKELKSQPPFVFEDKSNFSHIRYKEGTAENYVDVYQRARVFYNDVLMNMLYEVPREGNLIIVSHQLFLVMLRAIILKLDFEKIQQVPELKNGESWVTRIQPLIEKHL